MTEDKALAMLRADLTPYASKSLGSLRIDMDEVRAILSVLDRIEQLTAEVERLRAALEPFAFRNLGDDDVIFLQYPSVIVRCEVTYGNVQLARAALGEQQ